MNHAWELRPRTADEFAAAVQELRRTLDEAVLAPEPGPWVDQRGEFWANWELGRWVEAGHAYRSASRKDIDAELLGIWQVLLPERDGNAADLQTHLASLAEWARSDAPGLSREAWERAYDVVYGAAIYE